EPRPECLRVHDPLAPLFLPSFPTRRSSDLLVATATSQDTRRAFVRGFLSNVLNPKVALFYLTLLPQFVRPEDNVLARSPVLAGVHVVIGLVWLVSYAYFFSRVSDVLRRPRLRRALAGVAGAVLLGFVV